MKTRLLLLISLAALIAHGQQSQNEGWRRSRVVFQQEVGQYQKTASSAQFPEVPRLVLTGGEIAGSVEVMGRYGGTIEWELTFGGFESDPQKLLPGRVTKVVDTERGMILHVYPADSSVAEWKKMAPNSKVRYRGTIEGISWYPLNLDLGGTNQGKSVGVVLIVASIRNAVPLQ